jgi:aldose 1-epimerase
LQLYNGSGLTETAAGMLPGQQLRPFAGIALEPQAWPDAPHHPEFPAIRIDPITPYQQVTTYRITS